MASRSRSGDDVFSNDAPRGRSASTPAPATAAMTAVRELRSMDASSQWRLHVVDGGGSASSFHLDEGEHIIGRGQDASVRIEDDSISRKHARLVIAGDRLTIADLGSMNGTRVRSRPLKARQEVGLEPGESFELGSLMLVLQRRKPLERPRRRVFDHGYFENRVDEEIARRAARRSRAEDSGATVRIDLGAAGLTLCRLQVDGEIDEGLIAEILEAALPPTVIVAEYAPGQLELMFIEASWDDVEVACEALRRGFDEVGAGIKTGFAIFPRDGRTASSLLSVANGKLTHESELVVSPLAEASAERQGEGGAMDRLKRLVERVADSDISIVIHGETGVGKEVMAREVHRLSPRKDKPFVGLNCAALTETLLESELFGHERGAFSGAVATKPGLFEVADKGTVFLDEIGEMSLAIQAKLLRVLEERTVLRVGGLSPRSIDVRFLAASHKDLEAEVFAGRFRQDLYFRLNGITVEIPPLRERTGEIEGLAAMFIADACRRNKRSLVPVVSKEAMALLSRYAWPGNIRELRNIVERAVLLCTGARILPEHLPVERLTRHRQHEAGVPAPTNVRLPSQAVQPAPPARPLLPREQQRPIRGDDDDDLHTLPAMRRVSRDDDAPRLARPTDSLKDAVSDLERQRIMDALKACGGNQTRAAEMLGISRRTLVNRLDQYDLPRPRK
jgi:transcriptional regulator with GAF, ATPase, and Fis domain